MESERECINPTCYMKGTKVRVKKGTLCIACNKPLRGLFEELFEPGFSEDRDLESIFGFPV